MRTREEMEDKLARLIEAEKYCAEQGVYNVIVPTTKAVDVPKHFEAVASEFPTAYLAGQTIGWRKALAWVLEYEDAIEKAWPYLDPNA